LNPAGRLGGIVLPPACNEPEAEFAGRVLTEK